MTNSYRPPTPDALFKETQERDSPEVEKIVKRIVEEMRKVGYYGHKLEIPITDREYQLQNGIRSLFMGSDWTVDFPSGGKVVHLTRHQRNPPQL